MLPILFVNLLRFVLLLLFSYYVKHIEIHIVLFLLINNKYFIDRLEVHINTIVKKGAFITLTHTHTHTLL